LISLLKESSFFPSLVATGILGKLTGEKERFRTLFKKDKEKKKRPRNTSVSKGWRMPVYAFLGFFFAAQMLQGH